MNLISDVITYGDVWNLPQYRYFLYAIYDMYIMLIIWKWIREKATQAFPSFSTFHTKNWERFKIVMGSSGYEAKIRLVYLVRLIKGHGGLGVPPVISVSSLGIGRVLIVRF